MTVNKDTTRLTILETHFYFGNVQLSKKELFKWATRRDNDPIYRKALKKAIENNRYRWQVIDHENLDFLYD